MGKKGIDLNKRSQSRGSALISAFLSDPKLAEPLIGKGAKIDREFLAKIKEDLRLDAAGRKKIFESIITRKLFDDIILESATQYPDSDSKTIEYHWDLLNDIFGIMKEYDLKVDLNTPNEHGEYFLELVLRQEEPKLLTLLFDSGYKFDFNVRDKEGKTIMDLAMGMNDMDIVSSLKEQINAADTDTSFLQRAAKSLWDTLWTPSDTDDPFGQVPTAIKEEDVLEEEKLEIQEKPEEGKLEVQEKPEEEPEEKSIFARTRARKPEDSEKWMLTRVKPRIRLRISTRPRGFNTAILTKKGRLNVC